MVKGVNRQVLEICETGSPYFERAFFFVKPEYADTDEKKLRAAAQQVLPPTAQVPMTRVEPMASLEAEILRPAIIRLEMVLEQ